jgi:hypothetical protein
MENVEAMLCAYIEGDLDAAGRAEIEKHLQNHPQHRRLIAELIATRDLVRELPRVAAPVDVGEGLRGQVERSILLDDAEPVAAAGSPHRFEWSQTFAVAAVFLLTLGLGIVVYRTVMPTFRAPNYTVVSREQARQQLDAVKDAPSATPAAKLDQELLAQDNATAGAPGAESVTAAPAAGATSIAPASAAPASAGPSAGSPGSLDGSTIAAAPPMAPGSPALDRAIAILGSPGAPPAGPMAPIATSAIATAGIDLSQVNASLVKAGYAARAPEADHPGSVYLVVNTTDPAAAETQVAKFLTDQNIRFQTVAPQTDEFDKNAPQLQKLENVGQQPAIDERVEAKAMIVNRAPATIPSDDVATATSLALKGAPVLPGAIPATQNGMLAVTANHSLVPGNGPIDQGGAPIAPGSAPTAPGSAPSAPGSAGGATADGNTVVILSGGATTNPAGASDFTDNSANSDRFTVGGGGKNAATPAPADSLGAVANGDVANSNVANGNVANGIVVNRKVVTGSAAANPGDFAVAAPAPAPVMLPGSAPAAPAVGLPIRSMYVAPQMTPAQADDLRDALANPSANQPLGQQIVLYQDPAGAAPAGTALAFAAGNAPVAPTVGAVPNLAGNAPGNPNEAFGAGTTNTSAGSEGNVAGGPASGGAGGATGGPLRAGRGGRGGARQFAANAGGAAAGGGGFGGAGAAGVRTFAMMQRTATEGGAAPGAIPGQPATQSAQQMADGNHHADALQQADGSANPAGVPATQPGDIAIAANPAGSNPPGMNPSGMNPSAMSPSAMSPSGPIAPQAISSNAMATQLRDAGQAPNPGSPNVGSPNPGSPNLGSPNLGSPNLGSPNRAAQNLGSANLDSANLAAPNLPNAAALVEPVNVIVIIKPTAGPIILPTTQPADAAK